MNTKIWGCQVSERGYFLSWQTYPYRSHIYTDDSDSSLDPSCKPNNYTPSTSWHFLLNVSQSLMCWSRVPLAHESPLSASLHNSTFRAITLLGWNPSRWEFLQYGNWQMLQIQGIFFFFFLESQWLITYKTSLLGLHKFNSSELSPHCLYFTQLCSLAVNLIFVAVAARNPVHCQSCNLLFYILITNTSAVSPPKCFSIPSISRQPRTLFKIPSN